MHRELEGNTAGLADAVPDPIGQDQVVPVARHQIRTGLGDADDRTARLQLVLAQPEIEVALDIERRHVDILGIVEPGL